MSGKIHEKYKRDNEIMSSVHNKILQINKKAGEPIRSECEKTWSLRPYDWTHGWELKVLSFFNLWEAFPWWRHCSMRTLCYEDQDTFLECRSVSRNGSITSLGSEEGCILALRKEKGREICKERLASRINSRLKTNMQLCKHWGKSFEESLFSWRNNLLWFIIKCTFFR